MPLQPHSNKPNIFPISMRVCASAIHNLLQNFRQFVGFSCWLRVFERTKNHAERNPTQKTFHSMQQLELIQIRKASAP
eukprot:1622674-Amphidinium_carterae.1